MLKSVPDALIHLCYNVQQPTLPRKSLICLNRYPFSQSDDAKVWPFM